MFLDSAYSKIYIMDTPKTMEELIHEIDSLVKELEFGNGSSNAILYFTFDDSGVNYSIFGQRKSLVSAIAHIMVHDEKFRDIILAAYQIYIDYTAEKLKPALEPLIMQLDKFRKDLLDGHTKVSEAKDVCVFSEKFKQRHN